MSKHIRFDRHLQAFVCDGCNYMVEVTRSVMADPDEFVTRREKLESAHKDCRMTPYLVKAS